MLISYQVSIFICEWDGVNVHIDTDGDGISDFDELGGLPTVEEFYIDGVKYTCNINHRLLFVGFL